MKAVDYGITVDNVAYVMARKMPSNETTLRFLEALDYKGDPGEEPVDAALGEAANGMAESLAQQAKPPAPVTVTDLERADTPPQVAAGPEAFEMHLEAGDVDAIDRGVPEGPAHGPR
jgi:hypothetical protein